MEIILKYFKQLNDHQIHQFTQLAALYKDWNDKINVVSRKDIDNLFERHVLHSLSIAKFIQFTDGTEVMDLGTGGGFPAIPLAIMFPNVHFHAIDGTAKKILVLNEVANAIELKNIKGEQLRAEENKKKYDFIVTRAVASMEKLIPWTERLLKQKQQNAMPNGLIALKGGDLKSQANMTKRFTEMMMLNTYFEEEFFETKGLIYVQF